jgi:hypothetical protein
MGEDEDYEMYESTSIYVDELFDAATIAKKTMVEKKAAALDALNHEGYIYVGCIGMKDLYDCDECHGLVSNRDRHRAFCEYTG